MKNELAVLFNDRNNSGVIGGVGELYAAEAEDIGGNGGKKLDCGVTGEGGCGELRNAVVLNGILGCIYACGVKAFVDNFNGKESPEAIGCSGLCVESHYVNGADLAVECAEPLEVAAVALRVGISTGSTVKIVDVEVGKSASGNFLDESGNLVELCADVLGYGSVKDLFNGGCGDPGLIERAVAVVVGKEPSVCKLVASLVAELLSVSKLGVKDPPGLLCRYGNGVALLNGSSEVAVVNVDRTGCVNENNAGRNHTGCVSDLCNNAADLDLCAFSRVTRVCDRHCGVSGLVNSVVLELNDVRALDLKSAVEVLYRAVKLYGIALNGLICHISVINGAVFVLAVVYGNRAGGVLDDHCAEVCVGNRINGCFNVISALGYLIRGKRKGKHFCDGEGGAEYGKLGSLGNVAVSNELDKSAVLDLLGVALVILKSAVEKNLIANNGLGGHSVITEASVRAVSTVN